LELTITSYEGEDRKGTAKGNGRFGQNRIHAAQQRMSAKSQNQTRPSGTGDARFTSKADIDATQTDVRFVPIANIDSLIRLTHR
jgi:hypothetical protein